MQATNWDLHDGKGTFGVQAKNPHDRQLAEAFDELTAASTALDSPSIAGRLRIRLAKNKYESVKAAHQKWLDENQ